MKNLISGTALLIAVSIWLCATEKHPPFALLLLAISLFLMLKGYFKIISNEKKKKTKV